MNLKFCHKARNPSPIIWHSLKSYSSPLKPEWDPHNRKFPPCLTCRDESFLKHNHSPSALAKTDRVKRFWHELGYSPPHAPVAQQLGNSPGMQPFPTVLLRQLHDQRFPWNALPLLPPTLLRKPQHFTWGCDFLQARGIQKYAEGYGSEEEITSLEDFTLGVSGGGSIPTWHSRHLRRNEKLPSTCHTTSNIINKKWQNTNSLNFMLLLISFSIHAKQTVVSRGNLLILPLHAHGTSPTCKVKPLRATPSACSVLLHPFLRSWIHQTCISSVFYLKHIHSINKIVQCFSLFFRRGIVVGGPEQ